MKYKTIIYLLFTVSGFVGLIYESIWSKYLKLLLGHASYGQILTLIIYMGGLGLGAYLFGRISERLKNPLRSYAYLEIGIGLGGLLYHSLYTYSTELYFHWVSQQPQFTGSLLFFFKLLLALLLTAPWAILLGGTFPCLAVGLMRLLQDSGKAALPWLYFTNSLGGAAGILCTSYIFIQAYGTAGTLLLAGALNLIIGIIFIFISQRTENSEKHISRQPRPGISLSFPVGVLILTAAFTGFSSFLYEIGWIRLLSLLLGSSTHSFDLMISAFILGLAGGGLFARAILKYNQRIWLALALVQICMGLFAALSLWGYESLFGLVYQAGDVFKQTEAAYYVFSYFKYAVSLLLMFPASFCAGMTLPLITFLILQENQQAENWVGYIYACNTLGAIAGAALGGLFLMPLLQIEGLILLGALLDLGIGCLLLSQSTLTRPFKWAWGFCSVLLLLPFFGLKLDPYLLTSGIFRHRYSLAELQQAREDNKLTVKHGRTASISFGDKGLSRSISTNGKVDASVYTGLLPPDKELSSDDYTQASLAFLPLRYISHSYNAAIIGMGSGMTGHFLLADPLLQELDLIEIEPAIYELAKGFKPFNERVYTSPKLKMHLEDAKSYFYQQNQRYDLIISEPSNPWVSGVSSLFTQEFYRDIHRFLSDKGILVQWMHTYEFNDSLLFSILKAMSQEFPHIQIHGVPKRIEGGQLVTDSSDIIILASKQPLAAPQSRLDSFPGLQQELKRFQAKTTDFALPSYLLSLPSLQPLLKNSPPNSDFNPVVENGAELAFYIKDEAKLLKYFVPSSPVLYPALYEDNYMEYKAQVLSRDPFLREQVLQMRSLLHSTSKIPSAELDASFFKVFLRVYPFINWEKSQLAQSYQAHMTHRSEQDLARQKFELLKSLKTESFAQRQAVLMQFLKQHSPKALDIEFIRYLSYLSLKHHWQEASRLLMQRYILPNTKIESIEKQFLIESARQIFKS